MQENAFLELVHMLCTKDSRYAPDAYLFVRQALDITVKMLERPPEGPGRHVSGTELLEGIRNFALQEFGPMTRTVLRSWGINATADFGEIVFNLVESGVLGRTDHDSKADFKDGYDFDEAFVHPFLPESKKNPGTTSP
jgi:uncharacterized repeat protein (TIGR04138 family)